jgi:hypothetical protein
MTTYHHRGNGSNNTTFDDTMIPGWLRENCFRLNDEGSNLRNLNLNLRRLNMASILILSEALRDNKRIEAVNMTTSLSSNTQRHSDDSGRILIPIALALRCHVSLRTMYLSYNHLKDARPLGVMLELNRSSLTELYLDHNRLTAKTAVALARALRQNNTLSVLQLDSNHLGDKGGRVLAAALTENTTLKCLGLARNSLQTGAAHAFFDALDCNRNVSLVKLSLGGNPDIPVALEQRILFLVKANRDGRYLLRDDCNIIHGRNKDGGAIHIKNYDSFKTRTLGTGNPGECDGGATRDGNRANTDYRRGLWPRVLQGLEPDSIYFFLREKPSMVVSQ